MINKYEKPSMDFYKFEIESLIMANDPFINTSVNEAIGDNAGDAGGL